jgi:hypothetical protein
MKAAGWATAPWLLLVVLAPAVAMEQLGVWWQCGGLSACKGQGCGDAPWELMQCGPGLYCDRQASTKAPQLANSIQTAAAWITCLA